MHVFGVHIHFICKHIIYKGILLGSLLNGFTILFLFRALCGVPSLYANCLMAMLALMSSCYHLYSNEDLGQYWRHINHSTGMPLSREVIVFTFIVKFLLGT